MRATAPSLIFLVVGCHASAPAIDGTTPRPRPGASASLAASSSRAPSASASASASARPPTPPRLSCSLERLGDVAYDDARDEITACDGAACFVLPPSPAEPRLGERPGATLAPPAPIFGRDAGPRDAIAVTATRVTVIADPKRYAPLPAAPSLAAEVLFVSKGLSRVVLQRIPSMAMPAHVRVDLLDLEAHRALASATLCDYPIEAWARADATESLLTLHFGHDNPLVFTALVDLTHGRFVALGKERAVGYECTPPDDFGRTFARDDDVVLFDATRRLVGRSLVALDGSVVGRLEGDAPPLRLEQAPFPGRRAAIAQRVIDANRRVILRSESGRVCAGVLRAVEVTAPSASAPRAASEGRCLPCEAP